MQEFVRKFLIQEELQIKYKKTNCLAVCYRTDGEPPHPTVSPISLLFLLYGLEHN